VIESVGWRWLLKCSFCFGLGNGFYLRWLEAEFYISDRVILFTYELFLFVFCLKNVGKREVPSPHELYLFDVLGKDSDIVVLKAFSGDVLKRILFY